MISNQLGLLSLCHRTERVEGSSELTFEGTASLNDFLFDLVPLFFGDSRSERIFGQVTSNSDTGRLDHGSILRGEGWALKLGVVHVTNVTSTLGMTVVFFNNLVH